MIILFIIIVIVCVHMCEGKRTTLMSQSSPSTMGPGDGTQVARLTRKVLLLTLAALPTL